MLDHGVALHHEIELDAIAPHTFFDALDLLLRAAIALAHQDEADEAAP